jgi:hypothetical protein
MPYTARLEWFSYFSKFPLYIKEGNEIMMEAGAN